MQFALIRSASRRPLDLRRILAPDQLAVRKYDEVRSMWTPLALIYSGAGPMYPSATPPHLYVVEVGDTVVVCLVKPDFPGTAGETVIERAIERMRPAPYKVTARWVERQYSSAAPTGPGMFGVIAQTVGLAALAL